MQDKPVREVLESEVEGYETRPSLISRARNPADHAAWERFVSIYGRLIYGDCRRRGLRDADAEDVTQLVFGRVFRAIRQFEYQPEKGRFRDWLGTIVRNEVNRFFRKEAQDRSVPGLDPDAYAEPDQGWNDAFAQHILGVALDECRPHFEIRTWNAFEMTWLQRRSAVEVAKLLDLPVDGVYVAKSRVLKRLAAVVAELSEDSHLAT